MSYREAVRWAEASMKYQIWEANLRLTQLHNIAESVVWRTFAGLRSALESTEHAINREAVGNVQYRSTNRIDISGAPIGF